MNLIEYLGNKSLEDKALEFYIEDTEGYLLDLKNTQPFLEETFKETSLTVRYLNEKGLAGLSYTLSLKEKDIELAIAQAKSLSTLGSATFYPPLKDSYPHIKKTPYKRPSREEVLEALGTGRKLASSYKTIQRLEREILSCEREALLLIREGKILSWESPSYTFYVSVVADSGKKQATSFAYGEALSFDKLELQKLYQRACEKAQALSKGKRGKSLKCAILFPPESAIELLSLFSFSLKGDEVIKGRSFLKDKVGQRVFSQTLTIIDDGLNPELPESRPFDDEGCPQTKKTLIERGEIQGFIWDTFYALKASTSSTGNARRSDSARPPKVAFTNLYIQEGAYTLQELREREKLVFEVLEILGSHTADPISGDFSFGVSGILYERGEPVDYLSEMALSGNIFELFREVALGTDLSFFGSLGSPSILTSNMDLG
ncbi:MAG: metallopeptidase TldD-related protein [Caldimicrobium sp.]|nr:TldD/PmbA family protein [Caldimicrobium sp.]MCX7612727.1 TldD/PmbA family protein [Caldimicrobium sp.]MDW8095010.1 metallopeptidase TldD-related protein [Caldimicrobium sp.]